MFKAIVSVWIILMLEMLFVLAAVGAVFAADERVGFETITEWYQLGDFGLGQVSGAMGMLTVLGVGCDHPPTVQIVTDKMRARFLGGVFKPDENYLAAIAAVLQEHGCRLRPAQGS